MRFGRIVIPWVANGSGAATVASNSKITGTIRRMTFVPGAGGVQPDNAYDITVTDADGLDVAAGQGANLSNAASVNTCPGTPLKDGTTTSVTPMVVDSILTVNVTNAGSAKEGSVVLYVD